MAQSKKPKHSKRTEKLHQEAVESSDILERTEIEHPLAKMPDESADSRPVGRYDFRHPALVSKSQLRTMENLHSNLARTMASTFSSLQRAVVDVDIAFVDQTTYAEVIKSISNPGISYTFGIRPLGGPAIIDFSLDVAYSFVERYFGSTRMLPPEGRLTTGIDRMVLGKMVTQMMEDIEGVWEPLCKIEIHDAVLETNPEYLQASAPADTVVIIAFQVNTARASGLVRLAYPFWTLEPILAYLTVQPFPNPLDDSAIPASYRRQRRLDLLQGIDTEIVVEWGRGTFRVEDIADVRAGDTLLLDTRTDDPATVYVEDKPLFLARPGVSSRGRSAVKILRALSHMEGKKHV